MNSKLKCETPTATVKIFPNTDPIPPDTHARSHVHHEGPLIATPGRRTGLVVAHDATAWC